MGSVGILKRLGLGRRKDKSKEKVSRIAICPACEKSIVEKVPSSISGWLVPHQFYCPKCGYIGPIYLEIEVGKEVKEEVKEEKNGG